MYNLFRFIRFAPLAGLDDHINARTHTIFPLAAHKIPSACALVCADWHIYIHMMMMMASAIKHTHLRVILAVIILERQLYVSMGAWRAAHCRA